MARDQTLSAVRALARCVRLWLRAIFVWTDFTKTRPHAKLTIAEKLTAVFSHRKATRRA